MPELIAPTPRLRDSWLDARDEWGRGVHQAGSGLEDFDDVETVAGFAAWTERLRRMSDESLPLADGWVHATYWWIVERDTYLGAISLRHRLNDVLLRAGGHIGYGMRPSARRRGLASWALGAVLDQARARGIDRVLISCEVGNIASARVIERNGGVPEDERDSDLGRIRRYWIELAGGDPPRA
jgi:predicted acetyltransferase